MQFDIRLRIAYDYDTPAAVHRTLLRLQPRICPGQNLVFSNVTATPAASSRAERIDFFGNKLSELVHERRLERVEFTFEGRVQRDAKGGRLDLSCPLAGMAAEVGAVQSIANWSPHHFLGKSPRIALEPDIAAFARKLVTADMSVLAAVKTVSQAVHQHFSFDPSATDVSTTTLDAFHAKRGVCQDLSHVMISALRSLGIPAGYVSGFLRTDPPPGQPRLEGADAMHAWVRAWCGAETGWIEIDPTNDTLAANDHISVAIGRDYSDVAPVKGALKSEGGHQTAHHVDVIPV